MSIDLVIENLERSLAVAAETLNRLGAITKFYPTDTVRSLTDLSREYRELLTLKENMERNSAVCDACPVFGPRADLKKTCDPWGERATDAERSGKP
jgi:hypothetical protein